MSSSTIIDWIYDIIKSIWRIAKIERIWGKQHFRLSFGFHFCWALQIQITTWWWDQQDCLIWGNLKKRMKAMQHSVKPWVIHWALPRAAQSNHIHRGCSICVLVCILVCLVCLSVSLHTHAIGFSKRVFYIIFNVYYTVQNTISYSLGSGDAPYVLLSACLSAFLST